MRMGENTRVEAFTDVTHGTNAIARGGVGSIKYGFNCTEGWDPDTRLGTPERHCSRSRLGCYRDEKATMSHYHTAVH